MSPCKESEISQSKSFNFEFINNNSADLNSHRNSDTIDNVTNAKTDVYNNTTYINSNYQDDEPDPSGGSMSKTVKLDSANIPRKLLF
jgi:hypothetical protein